MVITAVSGIEIAQSYGNSWMDDVDFVTGRNVEGKLPGYSWCAVSLNTKVKDRYFGVGISCIIANGTSCIERLIDGPHYEMVIKDGKLYAGNLDGGIDVLDLNTLQISKLYVNGDEPVPFVRVFDGKLFVETYNGKYVGDF